MTALDLTTLTLAEGAHRFPEQGMCLLEAVAFVQGEPFSESWRMERMAGENQPWLLAGIRQNA